MFYRARAVGEEKKTPANRCPVGPLPRRVIRTSRCSCTVTGDRGREGGGGGPQSLNRLTGPQDANTINFRVRRLQTYVRNVFAIDKS